MVVSFKLWLKLKRFTIIQATLKCDHIAQRDATQLNSTGEFSSSGAVVTELTRWVELTWVRSADVTTA